jgi:ABC-type phosphate transport system substrate-binding protein
MQTKALLMPLLICLMSVLCIPTVAAAQTADVAVVVNDGNPVTKLSSAELRKIFAGEKRSWPAGVPIKIFVRAPGTHERAVLLKLLGMTEGEYKQYWTLQVFRGEAQAVPIALPSNGMQREAVLAYPGAVALVDLQDVKAGMKVLRVEGRMPGEVGYLLNKD